MYEKFGNRRISIVKELTKVHETVIRTNLEEAVSLYNDDEPKGEFVLVVEGFDKAEKEKKDYELAITIPVREHVDRLIEQGLSKKEAIKKAAEERGIPKREVYNEYENN